MIYPELLKDLLRYNDLIKEYELYPGYVDKLLIYRDFFRWRLLKNKIDPIQFKMPWITFPAIRRIKKFIRKDMIVFEYGSGGSTLFFQKM